MTSLERDLRAFDPVVGPPRLPAGDVAYTVHDTAVGPLMLAVDQAGAVLACSYGTEADVTARLAQAVSPRVLRDPGPCDRLRRQLDEYLAGRRQAFDLVLNPVLASAFGRRVLHALHAVPYATTTNYSSLAESIDAPRASRAVGNALGSNPIAILLPCHRVLRSDGSLGGYAGGLAVKEALLRLEGERR